MPPSHQEAQRDYYNNFGSNVEYVSMEVGHTVPSIYSLDESQRYYDLAGALFTHVLTNLQTNALPSLQAGDTSWASKGVLKQFFQDEFLDTSIF